MLLSFVFLLTSVFLLFSATGFTHQDADHPHEKPPSLWEQIPPLMNKIQRATALRRQIEAQKRPSASPPPLPSKP